MEKGTKKSTTKKSSSSKSKTVATKKSSTAKKVTPKKTTTTKKTTVKKTTPKKVVPKVNEVELKKETPIIEKVETKKEPIVEHVKTKRKEKDKFLILLAIIGSLIVIGLIIFTIANLNVKKLVCTFSIEEDGLKKTDELSFVFKDDRIKTAKLVETIEAKNNDRKSKWNAIVTSYEKRYNKNLDNAISVTTSNNEKNYVYKIIITADATKAKEENLERYNLGGITKTIYPYDRLKSQAELSGFKCK